MATDSIYRIQETRHKPPSHAWDYTTFSLMVEQDDEPRKERKLKKTTSNQHPILDSINDPPLDDYAWDNSPEQYLLHNDPTQLKKTTELLTATSSQELMTQSLTDVSSSDDEVFFHPQPGSRCTKFKRVNAIRKRRVRRTLSFHVDSTSEDNSPEDSNLPHTNELQNTTISHPQEDQQRNNSGHPFRPRLLNDVQLGPQVQILTEPLHEIQDLISTSHGTRRRHGNPHNLPLDYKAFHYYGIKQTRR